MKSGKLMDWTLIFPAYIFQPIMFPILLIFISYLYPNVERELSNIQNIRDLDDSRQLDFNGTFLSIYYLVNVFTLLGCTTFLKRFFKRPRPELPPTTDPTYRSFDLRTRETNCSFPSGDAAQSALFGQFLLSNFPKSFRLMGGPIGSSQFALAVSFARVYFHCHYFGDTVGGMVIGVLVGSFLARFGLKEMLKGIFLKFGSASSDDIYA